MKLFSVTSLIACILVMLADHALAQAHGHLYIGAPAQVQGTQLFFDNESEFAAASNYVKTLTFDNTTKYSNYFQGNITLTGRALYSSNSGPETFAASAGTFIRASIAKVEGPLGGEFAFWENLAIAPTIRVPCGGTSTNLFPITSGVLSPTSDPYGHIHGRRFTATKPGVYKVSFQAWDTSTNGAGGGSIHTPSELCPVYFQTGLMVHSIACAGAVATVIYGSFTNSTFTIESTTNFLATNTWTAIGPARNGDDYFQVQRETNNSSATKWYRVRANSIAP
jgi:hypothetical protein